ncbi:hypothetical protein AB0O75_46780 [Streptomyces sp. NPDC088921]|uniref:WXG100 family type VII secretion target n=1 Tax=unclassified Streptomyces TaxID=2593676 RepID=UPI003440C2BD
MSEVTYAWNPDEMREGNSTLQAHANTVINIIYELAHFDASKLEGWSDASKHVYGERKGAWQGMADQMATDANNAAGGLDDIHGTMAYTERLTTAAFEPHV